MLATCLGAKKIRGASVGIVILCDNCNAPIPNTEDNAKVTEVGVLLSGKSENFQDRSPQ